MLNRPKTKTELENVFFDVALMEELVGHGLVPTKTIKDGDQESVVVDDDKLTIEFQKEKLTRKEYLIQLINKISYERQAQFHKLLGDLAKLDNSAFQTLPDIKQLDYIRGSWVKLLQDIYATYQPALSNGYQFKREHVLNSHTFRGFAKALGLNFKPEDLKNLKTAELPVGEDELGYLDVYKSISASPEFAFINNFNNAAKARAAEAKQPTVEVPKVTVGAKKTMQGLAGTQITPDQITANYATDLENKPINITKLSTSDPEYLRQRLMDKNNEAIRKLREDREANKRSTDWLPYAREWQKVEEASKVKVHLASQLEPETVVLPARYIDKDLVDAYQQEQERVNTSKQENRMADKAKYLEDIHQAENILEMEKPKNAGLTNHLQELQKQIKDIEAKIANQKAELSKQAAAKSTEFAKMMAEIERLTKKLEAALVKPSKAVEAKAAELKPLEDKLVGVLPESEPESKEQAAKRASLEATVAKKRDEHAKLVAAATKIKADGDAEIAKQHSELHAAQSAQESHLSAAKSSINQLEAELASAKVEMNTIKDQLAQSTHIINTSVAAISKAKLGIDNIEYLNTNPSRQNSEVVKGQTVKNLLIAGKKLSRDVGPSSKWAQFEYVAPDKNSGLRVGAEGKLVKNPEDKTAIMELAQNQKDAQWHIITNELAMLDAKMDAANEERNAIKQQLLNVELKAGERKKLEQDLVVLATKLTGLDAEKASLLQKARWFKIKREQEHRVEVRNAADIASYNRVAPPEVLVPGSHLVTDEKPAKVAVKDKKVEPNKHISDNPDPSVYMTAAQVTEMQNRAAVAATLSKGAAEFNKKKLKHVDTMFKPLIGAIKTEEDKTLSIDLNVANEDTDHKSKPIAANPLATRFKR